MKFIIALLALVALQVNANALWTMRNDTATGSIVLTDVNCSDGTGQLAYSYSDGSNTLYGCWVADGYMVHVGWSGLGRRTYPGTGWTKITKPTM